MIKFTQLHIKIFKLIAHLSVGVLYNAQKTKRIYEAQKTKCIGGKLLYFIITLIYLGLQT